MMKYRMIIICAIVNAILLVGCTKDDEVPVTSKETIDNVEEKENELYAIFNSLALDFMTAMRTEDLNLLKEIVSSEFEIKIEDNQWFYVMDEPVDNQHIFRYMDRIQIWCIGMLYTLVQFLTMLVKNLIQRSME